MRRPRAPSRPLRFNEAAGFTQRKRRAPCCTSGGVPRGFNEAAGFTQRKPQAKGADVVLDAV